MINQQLHNTFLRTFNTNYTQYWHKDEFDRVITIIEGDNWFLQKDNELPIPILPNQIFYIPKETYHRLITGTSPIIIKIEEY